MADQSEFVLQKPANSKIYIIPSIVLKFHSAEFHLKYVLLFYFQNFPLFISHQSLSYAVKKLVLKEKRREFYFHSILLHSNFFEGKWNFVGDLYEFV
jgi:hypothetical protein